MGAIHQIYEELPPVIINPPELQNQHVEVIWQPIAQPAAAPDELGLREWTVEEIAAELGMKPEDIRDPGAMKFFGCLPDFPRQEPSGEYELRDELVFPE